MNVSKAKTATIMNKFTIQQLQQMRESEDRVEFKAGEGGNVSYDGRGKTNPKDRRRCILGYVIALCNEGGGRLVIGMHDNYPHRINGTRQAQDAIGQLESDIYRDTTIRPEARELQNARPANNKLNVFDLLALFRASQGDSQRYTDEVTLRKLIDEGLLISAQDGYKLSDRYYEIVKRTTANVTGQKDNTINIQLLYVNKLTERQTVIYNSIKEGVQLNVQLNTTDLSNKLSIGFKTMQRELKVIENLGLIVRVGSKKTGHWEVINKG